jgi:hypothetical protein
MTKPDFPPPDKDTTRGDQHMIETQLLLSKLGCPGFGDTLGQADDIALIQFKWRGKLVTVTAKISEDKDDWYKKT